MSKRNLSHINTLADLRNEIQLTDARVKLHEEELKTRMKRLPGEGIKSGISLLLPVYLNNKVFNKSWQLVSNALGALSGKDKGKPGQTKKRGIFGIASQLGLFTLAKTAYKLWRGK